MMTVAILAFQFGKRSAMYHNMIIHIVAENRITNIYGDVINRANTIKADTFKLVKSLENLIRKGYELATIVHFVRQVNFT